ncbi:indole-3-glycerol phosphate synthase TrpC [Listeria swaminathanii]|uniref:Indole-3-glycerol phosphate synthase n=1 Tax=Listeria swaminathanii TaxID=2713501 RepID=A0ABU2IAT4_9LIST|nr:indole-3-glycerol phosphate synthase TrpC [Listeria swaminathanii]MDT0016912.1 indole-3-glycerol phosphate synthase TrpC [Listeria swaminathanii]MDT0022348.1 indole-3-glycerol phosphate synthase TrpC [Listeria swaminathanii]MDT0033312.1 indole-3-glycerol phosphate synthase TrpC [Listeria swaminathanii]MDT0050838.1 indole-3-glycerol phosphate synthase TrpC [Listeria swaminathanii]MDT0053603.1 indole-3-glycerol phosphate synthase TrpC [Listeria swaminathanii]
MTFLEEILAQKAVEVAAMPREKIGEKRKTYSFYEFLKANTTAMQLIAEVKRASPSKGEINMGVDPVAQAKSYQAAGAGMISVLTDPVFFKGSIEDLREVARNVEIPVLCKDFIISEKQLIRARNAGATVVLLIISALTEEELETLFEQAVALDLEVLVEVHDQAELAIAQKLGAKLIGVNNRNLHTFEVNIAVSETLAGDFFTDACFISESGFRTAEDVARVSQKYNAVLVGEALMREETPEVAAKSLKVKR